MRILKYLTFLCCLLFAGGMVKAQNTHWTCDANAFEYDMTAYLTVGYGSSVVGNLADYEVAAFVGDECRGVSRMITAANGTPYLYMRIRSNQANGENVAFKVFQKSKNKEIECAETLSFKSRSVVGFPSTPHCIKLVAVTYTMDVTVKGGGKVTGAGAYKEGDMVTLVATPSEGWHFVKWSDNSTSPTLQEVMDGNILLVAEFARNSYAVKFVVDGQVVSEKSLEYEATIELPSVPEKEGYTFSGFGEVDQAVPAHDVTYTGRYVANMYKVTFMADGKVVSEKTMTYGTTIVAPEAPVKEGHSFVGWGEVASTVPAHDVTYTAQYKVNSYKLVYELDGVLYHSEEVAYGAVIPEQTAPTKEGHTFSGWSEIPTTMPAHDVKIVGSFAVNSYMVRFVVDSTAVYEQMQTYGSKIVVPSVPEKDGYMFSGFGEVDLTVPAHDVTYTGKYVVNTYKVIFVIDGKVISEKTMPYGTAIDVPEVPTKEGYTFAGFGEVASTVPAHDVTYTGRYEVNMYKVTFMADDKVVSEKTMTYGTTIVAPEAPAKEGHSFVGWGEVASTVPAHDVTYTAQYKVNSYKLSYELDGVLYHSEDVAYGAAITAQPAPTKEGHTFSGWSEIPTTMPARDVKIVGSFAVNSYMVRFVVDSTAVYEQMQAYGSNIIVPSVPEKEGSTFSGFGEVDQTVPAHDVTYTGRYEVNTYKVTFMADGKVVSEKTMAYGTSIVAPEAPAKEGHSFVGWGEVASTVPAHDVTYTAQYKVNSYKLSYELDGVLYHSEDVAYGAAIAAQPAPTKEGYTFSGWSEIPTTMPAHDVKIVGSFAVNSYMVRFVVDSTAVYEQMQAYGSKIVVPSVPEKEGYTFSGFGEVDQTVPAHDVTYIGKYVVNTYKVTFIVDGKVVSEKEMAYGTAIDVPEAPVKGGYTFVGWGEVDSTVPAHDVIYTGRYEVNTYKVVFIADDRVVSEKTMAYGTAIVAPEAPAKEGHTFVGWGEVASTVPAHDVTYTAQYKVNSYKLVYELDGVLYHSEEVAYGAVIPEQTAPTKEGHTFSGWSEIPTTMPAHDVKVVGSFAVNSYMVRFVVDSTVVYEQMQTYGSKIIVPSVSEKEGYTFSGFGKVDLTVPAHDVTYTGKYVVNTYKVAFIVDGKVVSEKEMAYGSAIDVPEAPVKEGYTFVGWGEVDSTVPAHDVTYTGRYEVNMYKVTFMADDKVVSEKTMAYGTAIVAPEAPAKEGHTFVGWGEVASTVPAHDVTYTAQYKVNSYKLSYELDGVLYHSEDVVYGAAITAQPAPTKEGHTFSGWSEIPTTMPAHDVKIVGSFAVNSYMVRFVVDSMAVYEQMQAYGSKIVVPSVSEKEGYTFSGFGEVDQTVPAHDVTYTGKYVVNTYKVTFVVDGKVISEKTMAYGSAIDVPEAPAKEGYTFVGWGEVASTVPANDVEYTAVYKVNYYKLTYMLNGDVFAEDSIAYGSVINPREVDVAENESFSGWEDIPETMPAHDVIVYGSTKPTGISGIRDAEQFVTVYSINGVVIKQNVEKNRIGKILGPGLYIVAGKKILVR